MPCVLPGRLGAWVWREGPPRALSPHPRGPGHTPALPGSAPWSPHSQQPPPPTQWEAPQSECHGACLMPPLCASVSPHVQHQCGPDHASQILLCLKSPGLFGKMQVLILQVGGSGPTACPKECAWRTCGFIWAEGCARCVPDLTPVCKTTLLSGNHQGAILASVRQRPGGS